MNTPQTQNRIERYFGVLDFAIGQGYGLATEDLQIAKDDWATEGADLPEDWFVQLNAELDTAIGYLQANGWVVSDTLDTISKHQ